jgi:hypothetical protein
MLPLVATPAPSMVTVIDWPFDALVIVPSVDGTVHAYVTAPGIAAVE